MTQRNRDTVLALVADPYRRLTIRFLRRMPDVDVEIDQLSAYIARETEAEREEVSLRLHHSHLPKLQEHGLIDYDPRDHLMRYDPDEQVVAELDRILQNPPAHPSDTTN